MRFYYKNARSVTSGQIGFMSASRTPRQGVICCRAAAITRMFCYAVPDAEWLAKLRSPIELYHVLRMSWSTETGSKWLPSKPARGQCSVTALIVQDVLGGEILKTDVDGAWHFCNRIDGRWWDLTMSQFEEPIGYEDLPSDRDEALSDTLWEKY